MCRIFFIKTRMSALFCFAVCAFVVSAHAEEPKYKPALILPVKDLFSHPRHVEPFKSSNIACTDCHNFTVKQRDAGPLATPVEKGFLKPQMLVCHDCHKTRVKLPHANQCLACHTDTDGIKPRDHFLNWNVRHGKIAQMDRDSCAECHSQRTCTECHTRMDRMNPSMHRANFRLVHSIQARGNPQSCMECHKSQAFCMDCHSGSRK